MDNEKRHGDKPIPEHFEEFLNVEQLSMLHTVEQFGWDLKCIRHPPAEKAVVIVTSPDGSSTGIVETDGILNKESDIKVRE